MEANLKQDKIRIQRKRIGDLEAIVNEYKERERGFVVTATYGQREEEYRNSAFSEETR
jgi:hypothetical protein